MSMESLERALYRKIERCERKVEALRTRLARIEEEAQAHADGAPDATGAEKACNRIAAIARGEL
jgi:hypothetical protein